MNKEIYLKERASSEDFGKICFNVFDKQTKIPLTEHQFKYFLDIWLILNFKMRYTEGCKKIINYFDKTFGYVKNN